VTQAVSPPIDGSIAIAGGGIIGLSVAWGLARAGWRVSLFEKNRIGGEASWAAAGMLSPGGEVQGPSALAALAIESLGLYRDYIRELGEGSGRAIDYQECGGLDAAYSAEELEALEARAAQQARAGIVSKPVSPAHIRAFWPRIRNEGLAGGRFYADDAIVNPREVVIAVAANCRRLGVRVLPECEVRRAELAQTGINVEAGGQTQSFDALVVAAGAWSDGIAVDGVPALPRCEPIRGHLIGYQQPAQTCTTIVRHGHLYLLQRANGLLIAGASVEHAGFDRNPRPEIAAELAEHAAFMFPHLNETTPSETWIGFRPASDALHIGMWHSDRLYLAYGHYRNGILLAPVTAKRIAAEATSNLRTRSRACAAPLE
jgi:glycine oxidase